MKTIEELQALEWPKFTDAHIDTVMEARRRPGWVTREMVAEYLSHYVWGNCPKCEWGRFAWGLQHGAGYCSTPDCGWPGRAYHFIPKPGVDPEDDEYYDLRFKFEGIMWAHPNEIERPGT